MEVEKAQQKTERALQNWKKAKATGLKKIHQDRVQACMQIYLSDFSFTILNEIIVDREAKF